MSGRAHQQLLHLVIGGELIDFEHPTFKDLEKVEAVGVFPNYASAHAAWKAKAQQTVDNAHMRYFIVHLHRLLDPSKDAVPVERIRVISFGQGGNPDCYAPARCSAMP